MKENDEVCRDAGPDCVLNLLNVRLKCLKAAENNVETKYFSHMKELDLKACFFAMSVDLMLIFGAQ